MSGGEQSGGEQVGGGGHAQAPKMYGRSVLATASVRYWRAAWIFLVVVLVNTAIQTALVASNPVPNLRIGFILWGLLSYLVLLIALVVIVTAGLAVSDAAPSLGQLARSVREHKWRVLVWTVLWTFCALIGFAVYTVPGLVVLLLTPFVVIAAADGQRNPLAANFSAIGARPGRYLVTVVVSAFFLVLLYLFAAFVGFFLGDLAGPAAFWFGSGIVGSWMITGWCLLYRSTPVGAR